MGMTRVRGFEQDIAWFGPHQGREHSVHWNIAAVRPLIVAPADMQPHFFGWNIFQRVVQCLDMAVSNFNKLCIAEVGKKHVTR